MNARLKKGLKIAGMVIVSVIFLVSALIATAVYFVFTPSKITPVVEKAANDLLDAQVRIGKVELTFFSTFPRLGLEIGDGKIISSPVSSGSRQDTLLSFDKCTLVVNPVAYFSKNAIIINRLAIDGATVYAFRDDGGNANWEIYGSGNDGIYEADACDNAETMDNPDSSHVSRDPVFSAIVLRKFRMKNASITFDDRSTGLYASMDGLNMRIGAAMGMKGVALKFGAYSPDIVLWQKGNLLAKHLRVGANMSLRAAREEKTVYIDKAGLNVNDLDFIVSGSFSRDTLSKAIESDLEFSVNSPSMDRLLELLPESVVQKGKVDTKGNVGLYGSLRGKYGNGFLPALSVCASIDDGSFHYKGLPYGIDYLKADFGANINPMEKDSSYIDLKIFQMKGMNTDILADMKVYEIFDDPFVALNTKAKADLNALAMTFPLQEDVSIGGILHADLRLRTRLSTIKDRNFGKVFILGDLIADSLYFRDSSAHIDFSSDAELKFIGGRALGATVEISSLKMDYDSIRVVADSLKAKVFSERPKDTTRIFRMHGDISMNSIFASLHDSTAVFCKQGKISADLKPRKRNPSMPVAEIGIETDSIFCMAGGVKAGMKKGNISLKASKLKDSVWIPEGKIDFSRLVAKVPDFALPVRFNKASVSFGHRNITLKKARVRVGRSNLVLSGEVNNLYAALSKGRMMSGNLDISSKNINMNQLMRAVSRPDAAEAEIEKDTLSTEMALFAIPDNINFNVNTDIGRLRFGKLLLKNIKGKVEVRDSHVYLDSLNIGMFDSDLNASMIYRAATKKYGYAGFDLKLKDINVSEFVDAMPAIDSLVPMLQSFKGRINVDMAAETVLDSTLNMILPSLRASVCIRGDSLVLMDGETFAEISKKLMFKNKKENVFDSISVNITVEDGNIKIYPFVIEIDRYKAAAGGTQYMDMSFDYHISILKSPLPFKAGLNISGTLDKMKFGIGKAKYKNLVAPAEIRKVDTLRLNLAKEISGRFRSISERQKWGKRAVSRAKSDWRHRSDSLRRQMKIEDLRDSIEWEK